MKFSYFALVLTALLSIGCNNDSKNRVYPIKNPVAGNITYTKTTPVVIFNSIVKATNTKPVSSAVVHLINTQNQEVLSQAVTDKNGDFLIGIPDSHLTIPVLVRVMTASGIPNFPMMVVDQHDEARHTYFADSEVFTGIKDDLIISIDDGSTLEGAFNVYGEIIRGYQFMVDFGGEGNTQFPDLEVRWESGEVGVNCTCFFKEFLEPATINLRQDEDDEAVILHEFGHYLQSSFSQSTSPGGDHFLNCSQRANSQLTWSEGWSTGFSLIVRKSQYYIDTDNQNFFIAHENPCHVGQGGVSEVVVAAMFLDLYDGTMDRMASSDSETISISFFDIWMAMKNIPFGAKITTYDYYLALTNSGAVTAAQWATSFSHLGLNEATMQSQD